MKDWLILLCIGVVAVFAFRERDRWIPHEASPAAVVPTEQPERPSPPPPNADPAARVSPPSPPLPSAEEQLASNAAEKAELAGLVGKSQRAALARYPSLGDADSELNIRFNYRYKRMLAECSPRLQDPAWPVQLADECAQAAGIRPVVTPSTPPLPSQPRVTAASPPTPAPPRPAASAAAVTQSLRVSPPAPVPAPAQTLVFHPAAASMPPPAPAAGSSPASTPPSSGALPFVTMDAVNQNSSNDYSYNWYSSYGWYDISYRQTVGIAINLRNMSRTPEAVNVRWIFFARRANGTARFIFAASGKEFDLTPGQAPSFNVDSPLIQNRQVDYGWIGERYMYGSRYEGWLVQLMERGTSRVIKQTGSTGYLEDLAKRSDFATVLEDYRKKVHGQGGTGL